MPFGSMLLSAGLVLSLDDDVRRGERRVDVSTRDGVALEDVVGAPDDGATLERFVDCEDGRLRLDLDGDVTARAFEQFSILVREQQDRFFGMIHAPVGEAGLIVHDQRDAIAARDVGRCDDRHLLPGSGTTEGDAGDDAARNSASDRDAVQHARHCEVIDVARLSRHLGPALAPPHGLTDRRHVAIVVRRGWRLAVGDGKLAALASPQACGSAAASASCHPLLKRFTRLRVPRFEAPAEPGGALGR
jgi:hypothetical protein